VLANMVGIWLDRDALPDAEPKPPRGARVPLKEAVRGRWRLMIAYACTDGAFVAFYTPLGIYIGSRDLEMYAAAIAAGLSMVRLLAPPIMVRLGLLTAADAYAGARRAYMVALGAVALLAVAAAPWWSNALAIAFIAGGLLIVEGAFGAGKVGVKVLSDLGGHAQVGALLLTTAGALGGAAAGFAIAPVAWLGACGIGGVLALAAGVLSGRIRRELRAVHHAQPYRLADGLIAIGIVRVLAGHVAVAFLPEAGLPVPRVIALVPGVELRFVRRDGTAFARYSAAPRVDRRRLPTGPERVGARRATRVLDETGRAVARLRWSGAGGTIRYRRAELFKDLVLPGGEVMAAGEEMWFVELNGPDLSRRFGLQVWAPPDVPGPAEALREQDPTIAMAVQAASGGPGQPAPLRSRRRRRRRPRGFRAGRMLAAAILNLILAAVELLAWRHGDAASLAVDAVHGGVDLVVGTGAALAAFLLARQGSRWARIDARVGLAGAAVLGLVSVLSLAWGGWRLLHPVPAEPLAGIVAGALGLGINAVIWRLARGVSSLSAKAVRLDALYDGLGSLAILVGSALTSTWTIADPATTALIGVLVARTSWKLWREARSALALPSPTPIEAAARRDQAVQAWIRAVEAVEVEPASDRLVEHAHGVFEALCRVPRRSLRRLPQHEARAMRRALATLRAALPHDELAKSLNASASPREEDRVAEWLRDVMGLHAQQPTWSRPADQLEALLERLRSEPDVFAASH
jgi:Co/Zn/Cd efflux system component